MQEIKKLYRAGSVINGTDGNDGILVAWYNADIKIYPVNYEDIIKDYTRMSSKEKMAAIKYVDEFFTFDQIELLGQFVKEEFGTKLQVEECPLPIAAHGMDEDNDEVIYLGFGEIEGREGTNTIQLNKLESYDLPFKVNGFYPQDDFRSSNGILEKLKTDYISHNGMTNQPTGQLDEEAIMTRFLESLAAGRVRFVTAGSLGDLDIENLGKVTIH